MAVDLISHPFRIAGDGGVGTVQQDTDDHSAEMLAVLILTRPGERELVPTFGLDDPTFGVFDDQSLDAQVRVFGPDVTVTDIEVEYTSDTAELITVTFE